MKNYTVLTFFLLVFCFTAAFGFTQEASLPRDIVVVVDVSGSMNKDGIIQDVRSYLEHELAGSMLRIGDRIALIHFGKDARLVFSRSINSRNDMDAVLAEIQALRADDDFTDIGSALENLEKRLESRSPTYVPLALFITDGKHAPPPSSPFHAVDISTDDHFRDVGKRIAMKGWNLYIIGLGDEHDAALVSAAVEGSTLVSGDAALETDTLQTYVQEQEEITGAQIHQDQKEQVVPEQREAAGLTEDDQDGLGSRAGIFIAAAAALLVLAGILFVLLRKRKS